MLTALVGALINIVLNFVMIPDHGAMGAAVATLISYLAVYVVRAMDTKRYIDFNLRTPKLLVNMLLIIFQIAILYSGVGYAWILQIACLALVLLLNLKTIVEMLREFLSIFFKLKNKTLQKK